MDTKPIKSRSIIQLGYEFGLGFFLSITTIYGIYFIILKVLSWGYLKWFAPVGVHI